MARRPRWPVLAKILISLTLIGIMVAVADLALVLKVLAGVDPWLVAAAVGLAFLQIVLAGTRWHALGCRTGDFVGRWPAMRIMFAAMFSNQILPTSIGGDVVRTGLVARAGVPVGRAARTVVMDRMAGLVSLLTLMVVTSIVLGAQLPETWPREVIRVVPVIAIFLAVTAMIFGRTVASWLDRWPTLGWFAGLFRESNALLRGGGATVLVLLLSYAIHATSAACIWIIARGTGVAIDYISILGFLPLVILVQLLPVTVGGWGLREGTIVTLFALLGIASAEALVVSILWGGAIVVSAMAAGLLWAVSRSGDERLLDPDRAGAPD